MTVSAKTTLSVLFKELNINSPQKLEDNCKKYNVHLVEDLYHSVFLSPPNYDKKDIQNKALNANYSSTRKKILSESEQLIRVKSLVRCGNKKARMILNTLQRFTTLSSTRLHKDNPSYGSLGFKLGSKSTWQKESNTLRAKNITLSDASLLDKSYIIPRYRRFEGFVLHQGNRGTCVANAFCHAIYFSTDDKILTSRQHLYSSCKYIDGIPTSSGTYLATAIKVLTDSSLIDYGIVLENDWPYVSKKTESEHQGPPPSRIYHDSLRMVGLQPVDIRTDKSYILNDINKVLVHYETPVVVGLKLFISFHNSKTADTGWVPLPLPGEESQGGHAMLIVGKDSKKKVYLVLNSWGKNWGDEGIAYIPFEYVRKYCHAAVALVDYKKIQIGQIPFENRLYENIIYSRSRLAGIAGFSNGYKNSRFKKFIFRTFFILLLLYILLLSLIKFEEFLPSYFSFAYEYLVISEKYITDLLIFIKDYLFELFE